MRPLPALFALVLLCLGWPCATQAQKQPDWEIEVTRPEGGVVYDFDTGIATATNGVMVRYGQAVLTAERVAVDQDSGLVMASGRVRVQQGDQVWASEQLFYNFKTREVEAEQFRTGKAPVFAAGRGLHADTSNHVYTATNALVTSEDVAKPLLRVKARKVRIVPGDKIEAWDATLWVGPVPIFYFPYYSKTLGPRANNLNVTPGYRGYYGGYLLGSYSFYLGEHYDGAVHLDYRTERGVGVGPDFNADFGRWGKAMMNYYYLHDEDPNRQTPDVPIPADRQRAWFSYAANPATNLQALAMVRWESDLAVVRDYFPGEYRENPQPNTFLEVNKFWDNWSVDVYAQPQVNEWLQTVERLPDVRLTGWRQRLGPTPLYYESETSAGYYQFKYAEEAGPYGPPPGLDYAATRADTFHQLLLPHTFFGWLNVTPKVGGRMTYYGEASGSGATTEEVQRGVFNTGIEVGVKAHRTWPGVQNKTFDMDGARHILEPMVNYVYIPDPSAAPPELPQFDSELPSLRLLPIDFPDYNAIDAIDSQNTARLGIRNRLQTKRGGRVVDVVNWSVYTDLHVVPREDQDTTSDIFSDLTLRPRAWLTLETLTRYNIYDGQIGMTLQSVRIHPSTVWSWGINHFYLRDDFSTSTGGTGEGTHNLANTFFVRLNEEWGFRASYYYDIEEGRFDEQFYTLYRDLNSWTAALTFNWQRSVTGEDDFGVAFTFSLKAFPRYGVGADTVAPYSLLGQ